MQHTPCFASPHPTSVSCASDRSLCGWLGASVDVFGWMGGGEGAVSLGTDCGVTPTPPKPGFLASALPWKEGVDTVALCSWPLDPCYSLSDSSKRERMLLCQDKGLGTNACRATCP